MGLQGINLPAEQEAREIFAQCFRILNSKFLDDDDCGNVVEMLQHLAQKYNYAAASLNLGSIYQQGLEPAIEPDKVQAVSHFVDCLASPFARRDCSDAVLEEASMALCNLDVSDHIEALRDITNGQGAGEISMVQKWVTFAIGKRKLGVENKATCRSNGTPSYPSPSRSNGASSYPPSGAHSTPSVSTTATSQPSEPNVTTTAESPPSETNVIPTVESQRSEAEEEILQLKEAANDLYKQGVVPGNKHGPKLLLAAIEKYKEAFSLCASGVLALNCAQAYVKLEEWDEAAHWAEVALDVGKTTEDSAWVGKAYHRLALSLIRIGKWTDAASAIDGGLTLLGFAAGQDFVDLARQLPAEEIKGYQWSSICAEKQHIDLERSLCGLWTYGAGSYKLSIEPWGSFVFEENDIRVDLKQSKTCQTHWCGEFTLIPGLLLDMRYNRTADTITSTFTPPAGMPEKERKKVPPAFVATRAAQAPSPTVEPAQEESVDEQPEPAPPAVEETPVAGPEEVTIEGAPSDFNGTYRRTLPDVNGRPLYRLDTVAYLWYRAQWGISQRPPDPSPFKCPFFLRIANSSSRPHPLYRPAKWEATGPNFPHDRTMYPCDTRVVGAKAWVGKKLMEEDDGGGDDHADTSTTPQVIYAEGLASGYYHKDSPHLYTKDDGSRIERKNGLWYMGSLARSATLLGTRWERADACVASMFITQESTVYRKDRTIAVRGFPACIHHASAVSGALTIAGDDSLKSALVDRSLTCVRLTIARDTVEFPCYLNEGDGRVKWSKAQNAFTIT